MSTRRVRKKGGYFHDNAKGSRDQLGNKLCRYCKRPIKEKGRRTFCGEACVHKWKLTSDQGYARECVLKRDNGVCKQCSLDCASIDAEVKASHAYLKVRWGGLAASDQGREAIRRTVEALLDDDANRAAREVVARLDALALAHPGLAKRIMANRSTWDMDHVVEVCKGGGECGLDNLQTLCGACHDAKTKALRAARKKGGVAP